MATISFGGYRAALANVLTTELNTLANNTYSSLGATAIDNTTNLDLFADFEFNGSFGTSPTAGTTLDLYMVPSIDGSNYEDGGGAVAPSSAYYVGSFVLRAVNTAQKIAITGVRLGPGKFKFVLFNNATGQSLAATSNTVGYRSYSMTVA